MKNVCDYSESCFRSDGALGYLSQNSEKDVARIDVRRLETDYCSVVTTPCFNCAYKLKR